MSDQPAFGFEVKYVDYADEPWNDGKPGWKVQLPHKCGDWRIDPGWSFTDVSTRQDALDELDAFIAEAQQARAALAAGQEYPTKGAPK
ncbi:hypothetical protein KCMC57_64270 (plasmid) [Kitasatospora sp. CMC57]|uniref:Uncharacterized protein n=1 Tax=Kitasatospora sp. CMC57 TaxID=3231513 RepID=A0AB33K399_9ACTN